MARPDDETIAERRKTEQAILRLRDSIDLEEDSAVVNMPLTPPPKPPSVPPQGPFGWLVGPVISVLKLVPPPHRVFIAGLLVLVIFAGVGKAYRWW